MELVKYHNDFNKIKLGKFKSKELNILFTILFALKDKGEEEISFDFSTFKELANLDRGNKGLVENIDSFSEKVIALRQTFETEDEKIRINLFNTIKINKKTNKVHFSINKEFQYIINDLLENYTKFDLKHMVQLKSKYSKQVFKLLKQFDCDTKKNWFLILVDDFKSKIGILPTCNRVEFAKIVSITLHELEPYFNNLKLLKLNSKQEPIKKGQKSKYFKFTWDGISYTKKKQQKESKRELEIIFEDKFSNGEKILLQKSENTKKDEEKQEQNELKIMDFEIAKNSFRLGLIKHFLESNSLINGELNLGDINKLNETLKQLKCQEVEIKKQETGYIILLK